MVFIGRNDEGVQAIYELYYEGSWKANNLTVAANAPRPSSEAALSAYPTEYDGQQHVIFIAEETGHICELYFDGSWKCNDLSIVFGADPPLPESSSLVGYASGYNQQQHVVFISGGHIYEIFYADGAWHPQDVTSRVGSSIAPNPGTTLTGYATDYNNQHHIIYIGNDPATSNDHICELFYSDDSFWQFNDLTVAAGIPIFRVSAIWKVPMVSAPSTPQSPKGGWQSSTWVGIDGDNINDVLQAGTAQEVDDDGTAKYYAWFQWAAPDASGSPSYTKMKEIPDFEVQPGDEMYVRVEYIDNVSRGRVVVINSTRGQTFGLDIDPPPEAAFNGNSAEWIMETPTDSGGQKESLPRFTPIDFQACSAEDVQGTNFAPTSGLVVEITKGSTIFTMTSASATEVAISYSL